MTDDEKAFLIDFIAPPSVEGLTKLAELQEHMLKEILAASGLTSHMLGRALANASAFETYRDAISDNIKIRIFSLEEMLSTPEPITQP